MHRGVDTWIVVGRQRGKTRAPIQGLSIRWGFSRYEATKMSRTIQSDNYVPGVSGWKIDTDTGAFELSSDRVTVSGVDPKAVYSGKSRKENQKPFIVVDGATYINEAFIKPASMASPRAAWGVKMRLNDNGQYVAWGFGLGIECSPEFKPDIIVKASHMEILPDGLVKITQAPE